MLTLDQVKGLKVGEYVYSVTTFNKKGIPARAKITGKVQTWKRDPSRVRAPWKIGLYEYGAITENDLMFWCGTEEEAIATRGTLEIRTEYRYDLTGRTLGHYHTTITQIPQSTD